MVTCASTRSEHGTPGPRRRQARSPAAAVPNTPGCRPDERLSSRPRGAGWNEAVRGTGVPRAAKGAVELRTRVKKRAAELRTAPPAYWPRRLAGRAAWRRHCPSGEGARHRACQWRRFGNGLTAATWVPARDFHRTSTDACLPMTAPVRFFHRISTAKTHRETMHVRLRNVAEFPRRPLDSARTTRILGRRVDSERGTACPADRVGP